MVAAAIQCDKHRMRARPLGEEQRDIERSVQGHQDVMLDLPLAVECGGIDDRGIDESRLLSRHERAIHDVGEVRQDLPAMLGPLFNSANTLQNVGRHGVRLDGQHEIRIPETPPRTTGLRPVLSAFELQFIAVL
jgi:hypothetical protein